MLKLRIQLLVERILSGGKPYIASHPELGVPIGIFNTKDEPNYSSRKQSIQKLGKKGSKLSHRYPFDEAHTSKVVQMPLLRL